MLETKDQNSQKTKLCLIAGNGELPTLLANSAISQGVDLTVFAVTKDAYKNLKDKYQTFKFAPTEIFQMVDHLKEHGISKLTFIGKVPKLDFFKNIHKLDPRIMSLVKDLSNLKDDSLHLALADFLAEQGLEIINQTQYLKDLFPAAQIFTNRAPGAEEQQDINFGIEMAKGIAALDIGQTVVVNNRSPLAIEAIEGTNECIKRAKKLAQGKPIIVCKVSKPKQDQRFDIPTVGLETVKTAGKDSIIAFEAKETFFVNQKEAIDFANKNNICIIAI